ncbi:hypothetical protein [Actinomadura latina]|uniref:Uncharacterized protein n=1 Tax=Actinomadura latina TaxID=163603 RepID=A0A846YRT7_9ACTN|nr:hypothetical protein [Actinomadura latina]NKZ02497.1 hypothetical protein [Actinomadura latina]
MGEMRPLSVQAGRHLLRWRTRVEAVPGGGWAYYEAGRGRHGYLSPCGDAKHAADEVDSLLKHRMFPSTWQRRKPPEASR